MPILLKIAPDLGFPQIDAVLGVVSDYGLDGIIATNTTLARPGRILAGERGGGPERGAALRARSTEMITSRRAPRAAGCRSSALAASPMSRGAAEKLDAGATLVQVYTGMIYRGPFFAADAGAGVADRQRRWADA